ncbi:phage tail spike protein, partial [Limosilactobacillus reuteri]|uniref:phage tail spike protein n=1 Tax=Limosilactobacillus reuteri TaxID=1598 RepID=UPI0015579660
MTEEINAANQINFSMPLKDRIADNIYYVAIPTPHSKQKYLLFKLLSERVQNDRIEYQGIEEAYDELKQYGYIKDIRPNDRTAEEMLKMVLEPTRWTLGNVPETNHQSTNFYYITYLEALHKIVGLFNIELTFEVTIDPKSNKITRRQVNVYNQQGQRTGKRFEYGSNLLTIEQEQDSQELITALVGRGKGEQVSEGHDDTPDGYGRRITFADVVWTKKNGNPVDKPAGQEYLVDPEATALYGFSDGNPRIGLTVFEDIEDPIELINATWKALQSLKRPKVSFKASVTDVGKLGLGDTVAIIRHDLKIEYFTRVYKVKHDLLNENNNQIELGYDFSSHSITNSIIKVDEIANEARETAGHAAIAANGKNNNYYSSVQPLAPVEGDIWYKDLGNGETDMYQYHNGGWVFIQSTRDLHVVENQVKEAQAGLNQAKSDIITNKQKADTDIENLNKSIEANKKVADESLQKLNDSVTNLQGQYDNSVVPNLNKVMADASDALQKYIAAQNSIADLTKQAQQQGKDIADVSNTVKGLNINYANLAGDVNSTKVDVKGLQTTVGTANGDIAQLKLDAQNLQTMLAGKVDNTTYMNFVNLTNQALNARLTASDLSGYAKTVDVQATANGLRVDLNSVTDRMNNLKIGGRNLIPNSGTDIVIESKTTDSYPAWHNKAVYWNLTPGETYTFSVSATNTNGVEQASVRIFKSILDGKYINKEAAHWYFNADGKRHSFTFTTPNDAIPYDIFLYAGPMGTLQGKNFTTTYHHPQLELGTAATDWRPNPDDTEHSLTELSARITANSQQFSSYYTKAETDNRTNDAKNGAINAIKGDGNWTGLSNILTNSGFLQTADGFLQKVQQTTIPMFNGDG